MDAAAPRRLAPRTVPPHAYFAGSALFHYLGPSFAVLLFARVDVLGVAWMRIASAALVFAVWRRPWRRLGETDVRTRALVAALGAVFACMNACFYAAIDRLPLATVAAVEFAGPIALANAALFTLYIVLAHRVARSPALGGIDGLAAAMLCALVVVFPIGFADAVHALADPVAVLAGIGIGVSSSVIPYVCDQLAMARLARATYALFVSLLPACAVVVGVVVLRQIPTALDLAGIGLVMLGVSIHRERRVGRGA
jgi:inner membrane transporter RhtA